MLFLFHLRNVCLLKSLKDILPFSFRSFIVLLLTSRSQIYFDTEVILKNLFIWLHPILVVAHGIFSCGMWTFSCGMWGLVPRPGIELGPLRWEQSVLTIGPHREVPIQEYFKSQQSQASVCPPNPSPSLVAPAFGRSPSFLCCRLYRLFH